MSYQENPFLPEKPVCDLCDFSSSSKKDFRRHLATQKHQNNVNSYQIVTDSYQKTQKNPRPFRCECGKSYAHKQNLYSHRKKCTYEAPEENSDNDELISMENMGELDYKKMFLEMMQQNKELQNTICELIPKVGNNAISNTNNVIGNTIVNNNSNNVNTNNNINISVFLNNNCKDACSLNDFVKQIEVNVGDLLFTSKKGLVNGLSNIIIQSINQMPLVKRPFWCVDKKRKTMYVKGDDEWSEDKDNEKTKEAIKYLTAKQAKNTNAYTKEHPDWMQHDKKKENYIKLIHQTTAEMDDTKQTCIINNLLDKVHLSDETRRELQQ